MNDVGMLQMIEPVDGQADSEACHQPVDLVPMERGEAERLARVLKAVSDATRLQLLSMIETSPGGQACVCDLTKPLDLTQPTVSHHLKTLVDAGLLTRNKRGSWAWYTINPGGFEAVRTLLR